MLPDTQLIRVPLDASADGDGIQVLLEADPSTSGIVRAARPGDVVATAAHSLDESFDHVRAAAESLVGRLTRLPVRPKTIELELGVKISAEAGAIIAKTSGEGNFRLRLVWERPDGAPLTNDRQQPSRGPRPDPE
ncbi:CU044_2847 family protein [Streptomyces chiangmaiensis]|uniref:CU044_2847 family protein n=1 Tax=Streptomyces chiangmaiensis TaxID=766497 RepID=A0ABU7FK03_9ACTN|nr:CU044_2847 family protein [Streptomyces chiangmaiensis]MED7823464.1 CU044_2847 family protein [Streptomyces chiangmaiensis]